ncbi:unnamed protein product [Chrysoparadoxa australica]
MRLRAVELRDIRRGSYSNRNAWAGLLDEVPVDISWMRNAGTLCPVVDIGEQLLNKDKSGEAKDPEDKTVMTTVNLLYPPVALRTSRQKRIQAALLQRLVIQMQAAFNKHFEALYRAKEDTADKMEERSTRIREIIAELGAEPEEVTQPWTRAERPESTFQVEDEMVSKPYESPAAKAARAKAEAEGKRREEEARGEDIGTRALMQMMHGTLEAPQESLSAETLVRPAWMEETPYGDMTQEQKKLVNEFDEQLKEIQEEQEKQRKALELELKKLRTERFEIGKAFDDKLRQMRVVSLQVQQAISAQELYLTQLAAGVVSQEDNDVSIEKLDKALTEVLQKRKVVEARLERFGLHVEATREEIEQLLAEDRALERNFKKEMQEAASNPIDMADMMAQLVHLYKLRDTSGMSHSASYRRSGGVSSARTSFRKSSMRASNLRESSLAYSKKRMSRVSSSGSNMTTSHGLGPLQEAMKEAVNREKKAKVAERDPFSQVDEKLARLAQLNSGGNNAAVHDLEYPGFEVEDQVWNRLLELRAVKINKETLVRNKSRAFSEMKRRLDALQMEEDLLVEQVQRIATQKAAVVEKTLLAAKNLEFLVSLKQGQDEVPKENILTSYDDAVLIPTELVEKTNHEIIKHGAEKVRVLTKMKEFRKSINLQQWDKSYVEAQCTDLDEYYIDLQLLRVTKKLQASKPAVLKGENSKDKDIIQKLDARIDVMGRSHADKVKLAHAANSKKAKLLDERLKENQVLREQLAELNGSIKVRETIYRSRLGATAGEVTPQAQATMSMKRITMRRRLTELARSQASEVEALKEELDRLRQRTFPSFAHAAQLRMGHPDVIF